MNVELLIGVLEINPDAKLSFRLPSGERIPEHFHVTEVGRVEKRFIDCGGTRRDSTRCLIQVWTADDFEHRLTPRKLAGILKSAGPLLSSDLLVEVEYGADVAAQYEVGDAQAVFGELCFQLNAKRTDCLAKEKCGLVGCCPPSDNAKP